VRHLNVGRGLTDSQQVQLEVDEPAKSSAGLTRVREVRVTIIRRAPTVPAAMKAGFE